MSRINWGRVLLGGLLAGVIVNGGEVLLNGVLLGDEWVAARAALGVGAEQGSAMTFYILYGFLIGMISVALYAAMRPRFGPGPKTAVIAGVTVWAAAALGYALLNMASEIYPQGLVWTGTIGELVLFPLGAVAGAWLYKEE